MYWVFSVWCHHIMYILCHAKIWLYLSLFVVLFQDCFPSYSCRFLKLSLYKDSWNIQIFFFINSSTVNVYIIDDSKSCPYKHIPQNFNGKIITPETNTTTYANDLFTENSVIIIFIFMSHSTSSCMKLYNPVTNKHMPSSITTHEPSHPKLLPFASIYIYMLNPLAPSVWSTCTTVWCSKYQHQV